MQDRSFDIAGPNPTAAEKKNMDEQCPAFLDREGRNSIAAALAAKQQQQLLQQASLQNEKVQVVVAPPPVEAPSKPQAAANDLRPRPKASACARHTFSCDWPRLSESLKDLKKALFGSPSSKAKRS